MHLRLEQMSTDVAQSAASSQGPPVGDLVEQVRVMQARAEAHWSLAEQAEPDGARHFPEGQTEPKTAQSPSSSQGPPVGDLVEHLSSMQLSVAE